MTDTGNILLEYDRDKAHYSRFCDRLRILVENILSDGRVVVHSITGRPKDRASLEKKLAKKDNRYLGLSDVTDLAGIRITTYFSDQVDQVAGIVENEFRVDAINSTDKRKALDPDRFGYLSLHYVVELSESRIALPEYRFCAGLKAEIQIRSVLQHAWAEIEHDLGYKSSIAIPKDVRRRFSRLAGMLELVDSEFVAIRQSLDQYEQALKSPALPNTDVDLDKLSLQHFIDTSQVVRELDSTISGHLGASLVADEPLEDNDVARLAYFDIFDIASLEMALVTHTKQIGQMAAIFARVGTSSTLAPGISIFYLCHVLAGSSGDPTKVLSYLEVFSIGPPTEREATVREIVEAATDG